MIRLKIESNKVLKLFESGKVYITENNIQSFHIELPSTFGDVPIKELTLELRCYLPDDNYSGYMGYNVPTAGGSMVKIPITNDITEKAQIVKVMFIATKDGNVIGKTNFVDLQIYDAPLKGDPLTPRKDFDEVINEQRATIESQSETITEQQGTISEQGEQITELNGEVTELQGEVAEQATTITRQNTTIDELNRRVPPLQTLDPINPSTQQVTYRPSGNNIGFNPFTVNPPTAEGLGFREDYYKKDEIFLNKVGTYNPFPYNSVGGIYITEVDEDGYPVKILIKNYEHPTATFPVFFNKTSAGIRALEEVVFENCAGLTNLSNSYFYGLLYLSNVILPENLLSVPQSCFQNCTSLTKIVVPHGVTKIEAQAFASCTNLHEIHLPNTLTTVNAQWLLNTKTSVNRVILEQEFNCGLSFTQYDAASNIEYSSLLQMLNALKDLTGETAKTLTIGSTNINKLTAEEIAIATNKNWNLA